MARLRDSLWIWGHPVNSLKGYFGIQETSYMSVPDGASYLGADRALYVPMGRETDMTKLNRCMSGLQKTGWSVENPAQIDEIVRQSYCFPNIDRVIFDDFFSPTNPANNYLNYTPESLTALKEKLHKEAARPLSMWMVYYTMLFDMQVQDYIDVFDGATMWFWNESEVADFDRMVEKFLQFTPNQRRMIGCYLYNFGEEAPATAKAVLYQLDRERELLREGLIEGVLLHTNAVGDLGLEAVEAAKEWIAEHGDEKI